LPMGATGSERTSCAVGMIGPFLAPWTTAWPDRTCLRAKRWRQSVVARGERRPRAAPNSRSAATDPRMAAERRNDGRPAPVPHGGVPRWTKGVRSGSVGAGSRVRPTLRVTGPRPLRGRRKAAAGRGFRFAPAAGSATIFDSFEPTARHAGTHPEERTTRR
jgi:hypothetical protein